MMKSWYWSHLSIAITKRTQTNKLLQVFPKRQKKRVEKKKKGNCKALSGTKQNSASKFAITHARSYLLTSCFFIKKTSNKLLQKTKLRI